MHFTVSSVEENSKVLLTTPFNLLQQVTYIDVNNGNSFLRYLTKCRYTIIYDVAKNVVKHIDKCDDMPNENSRSSETE